MIMSRFYSGLEECSACLKALTVNCGWCWDASVFLGLQEHSTLLLSFGIKSDSSQSVKEM